MKCEGHVLLCFLTDHMCWRFIAYVSIKGSTLVSPGFYLTAELSRIHVTVFQASAFNKAWLCTSRLPWNNTDLLALGDPWAVIFGLFLLRGSSWPSDLSFHAPWMPFLCAPVPRSCPADAVFSRRHSHRCVRLFVGHVGHQSCTSQLPHWQPSLLLSVRRSCLR